MTVTRATNSAGHSRVDRNAPKPIAATTAATNGQRNDKDGANPGAAIVFRCGSRLRRDVFVGSNDDGAPGTKLPGKPIEISRYRAGHRRLNAFHRRGAQKVLLFVVDELPESAAVKAEKPQQPF